MNKEQVNAMLDGSDYHSPFLNNTVQVARRDSLPGIKKDFTVFWHNHPHIGQVWKVGNTITVVANLPDDVRKPVEVPDGLTIVRDVMSLNYSSDAFCEEIPSTELNSARLIGTIESLIEAAETLPKAVIVFHDLQGILQYTDFEEHGKCLPICRNGWGANRMRESDAELREVYVPSLEVPSLIAAVKEDGCEKGFIMWDGCHGFFCDIDDVGTARKPF